MRIPAWIFMLISLLSFGVMTVLCSVVSYSMVKQTVVDARANGVEFPSVVDLVNYFINPPDVADLGSNISQNVASFPTPAPILDPFGALPTYTPFPTATPEPGITFTPAPTATVGPTSTPDPLAGIPTWSDPSRINILLMGIDQRSATGDVGPFRTDTMILVQIDPIRKRIGLLSIPRNLWVQIPGFQPNQITTANYLGDQSALPGGGPGLAMETIRRNFGVPVDRYIRINFDVFTTVVDLVSPQGTEICVTERIVDEKYPDDRFGTIKIEFLPGCQRLDAERLLQYARNRATQGGDFDRNRRQQEVLRALQDEVLSVGGITNFVGSIPELYTSLAGSYRTNLSLEEILSLARLVADIPRDNITFGAINEISVSFGKDENGLDILLPNWVQIRTVVQQTFDPPTNMTDADLVTRYQAEAAKIEVYNNTDIPGLAATTRDWLQAQGVVIQAIGSTNPPANVPQIAILDYTGKPWTTKYLAQLMGLPETVIRPGAGGAIQTSADVIILIGSDVQAIIDGN
ncbi:MAG: LCP family protein [bacterium]|nr:LCP family protein [bacterium]